MSYVKAETVESPRSHWKLISVLRDEGPGKVAYAVGEWKGVRGIGMRWNGDDDNPLGSPQSRGLATWIMVEKQMHLPIIQTLNEKKQVLAAELLGIEVSPVVELGVAFHPSGRYTLTVRSSGQRMKEDSRIPELHTNMNESEFFRAVYDHVKQHLDRGTKVVLGSLLD